VFNQIKTASTITLCSRIGTKSSVSLQLSKNMVKQFRVAIHILSRQELVQYSDILNTCILNTPQHCN